MAFNAYGSILTAGLAANLPSAPTDPTDKAFPRLYFATDTLGFYSFDQTTNAWVLHYQLKPVTVANLPTANLVKGTVAIVSDSNITTGGLPGDTVAGSGSKQIAVTYSTGTTWIVA